MSDLRVEQFLDSIRQDLGEFFLREAADERLREMRGHLLEAIAENEENKVPDPVGAALAEFGNADAYRIGAQTAGDGILVRLPERQVIRWASYTLLVPIGLDLAMDLSSWLTGSDSSMWIVSAPLAVFFGLRFAIASTRSRRILAAPLMSLILASFTLFLVLGGWSRATDTDGFVGTQSRGTAFRRQQSLIRWTLPLKERTMARIESGVALFAQANPSPGIGDFRTAAGYLAPSIPADRRSSWKGDPARLRWMIEDIRFTPMATYESARSVWKSSGPELLRYARLGVQGEKNEIEQLSRVVSCPWLRSVAAQVEQKFAMGLAFGAILLIVHAIGVVSGMLSRRLGRGRLA